ncbi:MAG TPA: hypothetical protein PKB02_17245 [Anaerohalosphaeraceae bacterium]|nr:hypothetical protein [Anaerohalosphaeraceae bacterium]
MSRNNKMIVLCVFSVMVPFLLVSCKKGKGTTAYEDIDYTNKFSLANEGDYAIVKNNQDYLMLKIKSTGPGECADVQWWYQKGGELFDLAHAETGTVLLYEKRKVIGQEGNRTLYKDAGSKLFIEVSNMHIQWSAHHYFYLPADYQYKIFNTTSQNETISLNDIPWKRGKTIQESPLESKAVLRHVYPEVIMSVSLEKPGCHLLVNCDDEYLLIRLESRGSGTAKIKWWHQKTKEQILEFDPLRPEELALYEKYRVVKEEIGRTEVEDAGSQKRLQAGGVYIEWSSPSYFYLTSGCRYKIFDENMKIESVELNQIDWQTAERREE